MAIENTQSSNATGVAFAEEVSYKILPGTPDWFGLEPDGYGSFGSDYEKVQRNFINESRQNVKGVTTKETASAGLTSDLTQTNMMRLEQGFFFADAHEKFSTQPLNGTQIALTTTTATQYKAASGLTGFSSGDLLYAFNMDVEANNGLSKVTASAAASVTVDKTLVVQASVDSKGHLRKVGVEFSSSDLTITASASNIILGVTTASFTDYDLNVGEWLFIGGDVAGNQLGGANSPGYARIASVVAKTMTLDSTTWTPATDTNTGKSVRIFFGTFIRNEKDVSLIKCRSYTLERTLGNDGVGVQSQHVQGAIANTMTVSSPVSDKITTELGFIAGKTVSRTGTQGVLSGNRFEALGEDAINTSSNIYRIHLAKVDPVTLNASALFAYVTEMTLSIDNGVAGNFALTSSGAISVTTGNFSVTASLTAYFSTVDALSSIADNDDVTLYSIFASNNSAQVNDMPLGSLGGGLLDVEKDTAIMIPLELQAAENKNGYTISKTYLHGLPDIAMPTV